MDPIGKTSISDEVRAVLRQAEESDPVAHGLAPDMSDEDAAEFDEHHVTLEKLRATPKGAALLAALEGIAQEAAKDAIAVAKVLAPIALEIGKEALISFASAELEKGMHRHQ